MVADKSDAVPGHSKVAGVRLFHVTPDVMLAKGAASELSFKLQL